LNGWLLELRQGLDHTGALLLGEEGRKIKIEEKVKSEQGKGRVAGTDGE